MAQQNQDAVFAREGQGTPTNAGVYELDYLLSLDILRNFGLLLRCPCQCLATKRTPGQTFHLDHADVTLVQPTHKWSPF